MKKRTPSPAMVVALLSLFVALSGVTYAATTLEKNSVKSKHIKDLAIKGKDVKDNALTGTQIDEASLTGVPLSGAAGGDLTGNYPNPTIANNAVDSAQIANNAVGTAEVAADGLTAADLANNAVGGGEIADDAVGNAELDDRAVDAATFEGFAAANVNFSTILQQRCSFRDIDLTNLNGNTISDDLILASPNATFSGEFVTSAQPLDSDTARVHVCNNGNADADPDGGGSTLRVIAIDFPG